MWKNLIRISFHQQNYQYRNYSRRIRNPGIQKRLNIFKDPNENIGNQEDFDDTEADFMNSDLVHKIYEKETAQYKEKVNLWIVKNKYFKTKNYNFLTWSEKEQIRYLHQQDPEEWTIDKLTDSFPVDQFTVQKIIKANWSPKDEKRVLKHDEAVKRTWKSFKTNQLTDIDPMLREHLSKFAHRDFDATATASKFERKGLPEALKLPEDGEFSSIILSCKAYRNQIDKNNDMSPKVEVPRSTPKNEMFLLDQQKSFSRSVTLKQLKKIDDTMRKEETEEMSKIPNNPGGTGIVDTNQNSEIELFNVKKYNTTLSQSNETNNQDRNITTGPMIREHIRIPKKLWKRGATYKVDDCFYDYDGEFLYRVPGITGRSYSGN